MQLKPLLLLALVGCDATSAAPTPSADLVVVDGKVTTLDETRPEVAAFAVQNGRVVAIGDDAAIRARVGAHTKVIDAHGHRVIPGLIDDHAHYLRGGLTYNAELRWDGVPSLAKGLELIREQAQRTPAGQWVRVVGGWSPWQFPERRLPTRAELDAASPDRPVYVQYFYSAAVVNTPALAALGFTKDSVSLPGTRLDKDANGELTGVLIADPHPGLMYQTLAKLPPLSPDDQRNSTTQLFHALARYGLTGEVDAGGGGQEFPKDYGASTAVARSNSMAIRAAFNLFPQTPGKEMADFQTWMGMAHPGESFGAEPEELELHGAGEYLLWAAADFENFRSKRPEISSEARTELRKLVVEMVRKRWPFSMHATYDETISVLLDVIEDVNREVPLAGLRFSIDHAETISERNIRRIRALGGGVAIQSRMVTLGDDFVARYGDAAATHSPPMRKLLELGVPFGLGTDATRGATFNPFVTLHWAVTGQSASGRVLYGPENRLSRLEALKAHTVGSAWFAGEEDHRGRLRPGQAADFAILSEDYFAVPENEIPRIESLLTVVAGRPVYGAGQFATLSPSVPPPSPSWSPVSHQDPYWR